MISFMWNFHNKQIHSGRKLISGRWAGGAGTGRDGLIGIEFPFGVMKMVLN